MSLCCLKWFSSACAYSGFFFLSNWKSICNTYLKCSSMCISCSSKSETSGITPFSKNSFSLCAAWICSSSMPIRSEKLPAFTSCFALILTLVDIEPSFSVYIPILNRSKKPCLCISSLNNNSFSVVYSTS